MMDMREILKKVPDCTYDPCDYNINTPRYIMMFFTLMLGEKAGWWNVMTADDIKFVQGYLREMKEDIPDECFDSYAELTWDVNSILEELFVQIFNAYLYSDDIDEENMEFGDIESDFLRKELQTFCEDVPWILDNSNIWIFELDPLIGYYMIHPEEFTLSKNERVWIESIMHNLTRCSEDAVAIFFDRWWCQKFVYTNEQSWYIVQLGSADMEFVENAAFDFKKYVKYLELCDLLNKSYREGIQGISA